MITADIFKSYFDTRRTTTGCTRKDSSGGFHQDKSFTSRERRLLFNWRRQRCFTAIHQNTEDTARHFIKAFNVPKSRRSYLGINVTSEKVASATKGTNALVVMSAVC